METKIKWGNRFIARPARGTYAASKFAIEAIHESLSYEVETFGIKVLIVEPGAFRTPFASRVITPARYAGGDGYSIFYQGTAVEKMFATTREMTDLPDFMRGDPDKAARAILRAATDGHDYLRMILGADCVEALESKLGQLKRDLEATRAIATETDVD